MLMSSLAAAKLGARDLPTIPGCDAVERTIYATDRTIAPVDCILTAGCRTVPRAGFAAAQDDKIGFMMTG